MARETFLKGKYFLINILECNQWHWLLWANLFGLHFCFHFSCLVLLSTHQMWAVILIWLFQTSDPLHQENASSINWHLAWTWKENDYRWYEVLPASWSETPALFRGIREYTCLFSLFLLDISSALKNVAFRWDSELIMIFHKPQVKHLPKRIQSLFVFNRFENPNSCLMVAYENFS